MPAVTSAGTEARAPGRLALLIIVSAQLMLIVDGTVMNVALPHIQEGLGFSTAGLSWVINAYTLTFGGLLLLGGRAGDILGRRRMFVVGIALFTVASLVGGLATSAAWLLAARVAQGVGAALAGPNTIALISTTFTEPQRRIRALALLSAMASAGFAIGLILGGVLTDVLSWRWVLFINVPFGIAAVLLAPRHVREPERHPGRLEWPAAATATLGIGALVYGFIHASTHGWTAGETLVSLALGVVLLVTFLAIQLRSAQPLVPLSLFKDRNRAVGFVGFLLGPAAMMSAFYFLTQFLQIVLGFGPLKTGLAFLPMAGSMFAMTRIVPRLLHRIGPRPLALTGAPLMMAGLAWLTQLDTTSGYAGSLLGPMILLGLGGGLTFVPLTPVIMGSVQPRDAGAAGGVLQTMQQVGATLGLAVLIAVFGAAVGPQGAAGATDAVSFVHGMNAANVVSVVIAAGLVVVALSFRSVRRPAQRQPEPEVIVEPA
ncbi:drug resistance transporter, EmrB/QacA subfamily [Asanoa hainanensis]|uniref:Drug resistance transporter, EmrB/QacA subfamily n=1 Tax=Asanoa hainanensis TaxID=560556 RepID=A0A239PER4_9ACTN|nr:MFS transporter [Asanoa hainanensis]SNT65567.1 drug resistance transporter, EmrB/QacA subfamily [Asanoa hainanensis]